MLEGKKLGNIPRLLRAKATPWENKLWFQLRGNRFYGLKFKRQVPLGNYVVDFCCQGKRLVIELDGSGHSQNENIEKDKSKAYFLEHQGYTVLRFWNNDIDKNLAGVLQRIKDSVF